MENLKEKKLTEEKETAQNYAAATHAAFWKDTSSALLTGIGIVLTLNLAFVIKIAATQTEDGKELVRLKTTQISIEDDIKDLKAVDEIAKANIYSLKIDYITMIKDWTDANYVRKQQK